MAKMIGEEWKQFILEKPRPAIAAVLRKDNRPLATPVWVDVDGDDLVFTTGRNSGKGRAIRVNPQVVLVVQDENAPFSFVMVEGTASVSEDPEEIRMWAGRLGGRYMGSDQAHAYADRNGVPGEMVVRVAPSRIVGERAVAS